ncbi:MAG: hypothetical protein ABGW82_08055 [Paracoccus sp. (in: a-proteobacteria)]|jgi:hypothetical protein|uniref:hypothetical protein n=1 Tax=Paracoccus sp. TaxID=267 RepID=UPI0025EABE5F|nr:hypothetical protein [Paracoccus sp. (in: a-proteobacteria)]MCS5602940.1 hypothetical protein [Paracoccus sp. (in: a-proteobacteria)]|tara:strand:+ start:1196 stop:1351 length:156 start_codon:yes stop_codon:yes gene_type:complete
MARYSVNNNTRFNGDHEVQAPLRGEGLCERFVLSATECLVAGLRFDAVRTV